VPVGRVAGANPGERAQRLGRAGVDGGREQEDGDKGGGHGGRVAGIHIAASAHAVRDLTGWTSSA